jgi:hypothetical protein
MLIGKQDHPSIKTGETGWISIHINETDDAVDHELINAVDSKQEFSATQTACHLFQYAVQGKLPLADRFPRLTLLAVALALLVSAVAVEIEYLRGAGYYWH